MIGRPFVLIAAVAQDESEPAAYRLSSPRKQGTNDRRLWDMGPRFREDGAGRCEAG
jgi:hypothetical protein